MAYDLYILILFAFVVLCFLQRCCQCRVRTIFITTTFGIVFFLTDPQQQQVFYHLLFFMLRLWLKFIYWDGGENFFGSSTSQRLGIFLKKNKR